MVATYATSFRNSFVYDDIPQILQNPWMLSLRSVPEIFTTHVWGFNPLSPPLYYRPTMHLVNLAVFQVAGPSPWAFQLVSVLLHVAVVLVGARLIFRLLGGAQPAAACRGALIGGLVFAVHPVNTEVIGVRALPDLLCALFSLLCVGSHAQAGGGGWWIRSRSLLWLVLALLSKETALVVPGLLLAVELHRKESLRGIARRLAPGICIAAAYFALRTTLLGGPLPAGLAASAGDEAGRSLRVLASLLHYSGKLLFPWPLAYVYELRGSSGIRDVLLAPGAWVLAAWAAFSAARWTRERTPALSLAFFLVPLLPALFAALVLYSPLADRYLYFPSFGFALCCGLIGASRPVARGLATRTVRALSAAGVLAAGAACALRITDFRTNLSLWADTARKTPASSLARGQHAAALFADGQYEAGVREGRKAIELDPGNPVNHFNLALASERQGLWEVAAAGYRQVIALGRDDSEVLTRLASVLLSRGDTPGAVEMAARAVSADPANPEARYVLGRALVIAGDLPRGARELAAAARLRPEAAAWRRDAEEAARLTRTAPPGVPGR